jgi:uncharacterized short protein YbdD (DUF466 family)
VRALQAVWSWLRAVSGDSAYESYLRRAGAAAMSREEFWLDTLRRRYGRDVSRCC